MFKLYQILTIRSINCSQIQKFCVQMDIRKKTAVVKKVRVREDQVVDECDQPFPAKLLSKKHKTPTHMYIQKEETAILFHKSIQPYLEKSTCKTLLEINPGIGLLTQHLIDDKKQFEKIILMETLDHFMPKLEMLSAEHSPDRVILKHGDFIQLYKSHFQDKLDNGSRVANLLENIPKKAFAEEPNMIVVGSVGSYQFFKSLIISVIFQNILCSYGRCEMYLAVPPPIYINLTCGRDVGYFFYRSMSVLFQILFEYRYITSLPREDFLPPEIVKKLHTSSKLRKIKSVNPEHLYLIRLIPRQNILDLCAEQDLPALWYFVKQNFISRRNRIIPNLEKWIPGCGPRLIINKHESIKPKQTYADEDPKLLPTFSTCCVAMTNRSFYEKINIYTQFGDLSPCEMLTLFTQFRSWPQYNESPFLASLENSLLKLEASTDDESIDSIIATEEDDESDDSANLENEPAIENKEKGIKTLI